MELIRVTKLNDIKLYEGQLDEDGNTIDYHLDFAEYRLDRKSVV